MINIFFIDLPPIKTNKPICQIFINMKILKPALVLLIFALFNQVQAQYTLLNDDVEVVNGVIVKCSYNFANTNIVIPDSLDNQKVIGIGNEVFMIHEGDQITSVQFPDSLETIGNNAFQDNDITIINIPPFLTYIGDAAFFNNHISSLNIPENIKAIGDGAFSYNSMSTLTFEEGITSIGHSAFNNNNITDLSLPNSLTNLGNNSFENNQISNLILGSGIQIIPYAAFNGNNLSSLTIPEGVTSIQGEAFANNNISSLALPNSLTEIQAAFSSNSIIEVNGETSQGIIFSRNGDGTVDYTTISSYGGTANVIDFIPETVTNIGESAFQRNGLTAVTIPSNVETIWHYAFNENNISNLILNEGLMSIEEMAFFDNKLTSLTIPSTVIHFGGGFVNMNTITTINGEATNGIIYALNDDGTTDNTKVISYAGSIKEITADLFPETLTTIGYNSFQNSELASVTIPSSVTKIENNAFANNLITSLSLASGLELIQDNAFNNNKLATVTIPNTVELIGSSAFGNNLLTSVTLPSALTTLYDWVFHNNELATITIPSTVTYIGNDAFSNNKLSSITIPANVTYIGNAAFYANLLTSVSIPANVEYVGNIAFSENNINTLTLTDGLKIVGASAFSHNQLEQNDLNLPTSVSSIGKNAFSSNNGLDSIYLHQPNVSGFVKWIDGYGTDQVINTWVKDLATSYVADVELMLSSDDIEIVDGIIMSVNYDIRANKITIPRILNDQVVLGTREDHDDMGNYLGGLFSHKKIKEINLPTSFMYIGSSAFSNNLLSEITLPDSTKYIGHSAFENNPEINSITLPDPTNDNFIEWTDVNGNTYDGGTVVYNLANSYYAQYIYTLTDNDVVVENGEIVSCSYDFMDKNIIIPETLDEQTIISIGELWFENEDGPYSEGIFQNKGIVSIQFPATLDTIGENAFNGNQIEEINLLEDLLYIKGGAFSGNQLINILLPEGLRLLGHGAFSGNHFTKITLPSPSNSDFVYWYDSQMNIIAGGTEITDLDEMYTALYKYTLTDDDVEMENGAIISCSYDFESKYLVIPETLDGHEVTKINEVWKENEDGPYIEGMFQNNELIGLELPATLDTIFDFAFGWNQINYIEIPEGLNHIGAWAFHSNHIDSLVIPTNIPTNDAVFTNNRIKKLNGETFDGIFYKVTEEGIIDSTSIAYYADNDSAFDFVNTKIETILPFAFSSCHSLSQVSLTTNIIKVGDWAFQGTQLKEIDIPNSVTSIGTGAFAECGISEFTLPTPQTDDFLHWYDDAYPMNTYSAGEVVTNLYNRYNALIKYILTDEDVVMENGTIISTSYDYRSAYIIIPDTLDGQQVVSIGEIQKENEDGTYMDGMFQSIDGTTLIGVDLPSSLDTIGYNAFGWNQITEISLPANIRCIKGGAFQGNYLTSINIPEKVTYIGHAAFAECQLTEFTLPNPLSTHFLFWVDDNHPYNTYEGGTTVSNLWNSYKAMIKYTLTDEDVVVENNTIIQNDYDYRSPFIIIPDTLDGQEINSIGEYWYESEIGPYPEGMFQGMDENYLIGVELPSTLDTIGINAFGWNQIEEILIPDGVIWIKSWALAGNNLKEIEFPNSLRYIGDWSFAENNEIFTQMILPENPLSNVWIGGDDQTYLSGDILTDFEISYMLVFDDNVNSLNSSNEFLLYPNPTRDILNIEIPEELQNYSVEIYNIHGTLVHETLIWNGQSINILSLNNGIYILRMKDLNGKIVETKKFIKE
jgi:Leucine Rich Repeat (LRR) protein/type IX secretion system substrate protein